MIKKKRSYSKPALRLAVTNISSVYKQRKNDILVYQEKAVQEKEQALAKKGRQKNNKIPNSGFWMSLEDALASDGLVVSHLPDTQSFEVVYILWRSDEIIYEFELLDDYDKNDLKFLSHVHV